MKPSKDGERKKRYIGGFFELHDWDAGEAGQTILENWTAGRRYSGFGNARSAFSALVSAHPDVTVWLPAFVCSDLVDPSHLGRTRFYPVLDGFAPDVEAIEAAETGDIVVFVAHFGLPLGRPACGFMARRPDLIFVEDRAQALDTGQDSSADFCLYSPRKLLGVADGGILVANQAISDLPHPSEVSLDRAAVWAPALLRYEDRDEICNDRWHMANRVKEASMDVTPIAMSRFSMNLLKQIPLAGLRRARIGNWDALDRLLRPWSALPSYLGAAPLGYVLRVGEEQRDALLGRLHAEGIFAAVHWRDIPVSAEEFPREKQWTRQLITLPCDHRYNQADMDRIAACVTDSLR